MPTGDFTQYWWTVPSYIPQPAYYYTPIQPPPIWTITTTPVSPVTREEIDELKKRIESLESQLKK